MLIVLKKANCLFFFSLLGCAAIYLPASAQDTPKRVSITVEVKQRQQSDILQLPAENLPTVVDRTHLNTGTKSERPIHKSIVAKKTKNPLHAAAKVSVKQNLASKNTVVAPAPKTIVEKTPKANDNPISRPSPLANKTAQVAVSSTTSQNKALTEIPVEKQRVATENRIPENDNPYTELESSNPSNNHGLTYVWVGALLVIAGMVLGLLFGRSAYLIAACGIIFIVFGAIM